MHPPFCYVVKYTFEPTVFGIKLSFLAQNLLPSNLQWTIISLIETELHLYLHEYV